ncbi:MAG: SBBP repeat-containing protein [candidate division Zixibacteria bacterium]|nr:SBBP repeat-containing protein [candidate division Zixibacteria bacterium]
MINRVALLSVLFCCAVTAFSQQVIREDWVAGYSGPGYDHDQICDMAVDKNGFVYVTGFVRDGVYTDYLTIKYTNQGDTAWTRTHHTGDLDVPGDLVVDREGSVFIAGLSSGARCKRGKLLKYNTDGDLLWAKTYRFVSSPSLAIDNDGGLYIAGPVYAAGDQSHLDCMVIKYRPDGDSAWVRQYNAGNASYFVNEIATDGKGDIIIAGYRVNDGKSYDDMDAVTLKFTSKGDLAWERTYDHDQTAVCLLNGVAIDSDNNVCVAGSAQHSSDDKDNTDMLAIKYGPNGDTAWIHQYNSPGDSTDVAEDIAVDSEGNVFVGGYSMTINIDEYDYDYDYVTIKYSTDGKESWVRSYNTGPEYQDQIAAIAVDTEGAVYCTGSSRMGESQYVTTIKYNCDGGVAWLITTEESACNPIKAVAVAVRAVDSLVVAGYGLNKETGRDFVTIQYVPTSPRPIIALDREKFDYIGLAGVTGAITDSFTITNAGDGRLFWSATCRQDWLTLIPDTGSAPATVKITVDIPSLSPGMYRDTIMVSSSNAANSPQMLPVKLNLKAENDAPAFAIAFRDTILIEDDLYDLEIAAVDNDLDSLILECLSAPDHATFVDSGNGKGYFSLPTSFVDVGQAYSIAFKVTDRLAATTGTVHINVTNRDLTVVEPQPGPGEQYDDIKINTQPLAIQFNEQVDPESLSGKVTLVSARGDDLHYQFNTDERQLQIFNDGPYLLELDTITISLAADILDLAGYPLGVPYQRTLITGLAVFPGDTDDDGVVDERDILPFGRYWGHSGPSRSEAADIEWGLKAAHRWENTVATYVDADGSGHIDGDDICAIAENWLRTQNQAAGKVEMTPGNLITLQKEVTGSILEQIAAGLSNCRECAGKQALWDMLGTAESSPDILLPTDPELYQNYPNPFNPSTTIRLYLPQSATVSLSVYNIAGQKVATLLSKTVEPGYTSVVWNGDDGFGHQAASGVYFYRLETGTTTISRRMLLLK